ncbi:MAG: hypothetical protein ACOCX1_01465 [Fimbriimonadaceae bacterium]
MKFTSYAAILGSLALVSACGNDEPADGNEPEPVQVEDVASLFPFEEGNSWVYDVTIEDQAAGEQTVDRIEATMEIVEINDLPDGGREAIMELRVQDPEDPESFGEGPVERTRWIMDDGGILQSGSDLFLNEQWSIRELTPPQPVIPWPIVDGEVISYEGVGPRPRRGVGDFSADIRVIGTQMAEVAMEMEDGSTSVPALAVETRAVIPAGQATAGQEGNQVAPTAQQAASVVSYSYWADGIGLVRYRQVFNSENVQSTQTLELKNYSFK